MSRELKFRVWDNIIYMSNPFTLQDLQAGKIQFTSYCIVMQFTGLNDKSGKEIYEGDIIGDSVVVFANGRFNLYYDFGSAEEHEDPFETIIKHVVVRGNIYENPDLSK